MGANFKLIFKYFALNVKKEYAYKASFYMQILMMLANNLFLIIQWVVLFKFVGDIGGYNFSQIMILLSISCGAYGISHLFFYGANNYSELVYDGKIDVFLNQPKNLLLNISCSQINISAGGDLISAFVFLAIGGVSWWTYFAVIPFIILSGLILTAFVAILNTLCFYVKKGDAFANTIGTQLLNFSTYPMNIFSTPIKWILFTLIPVGFFTFIPVSLIISFNWWFLLAYLAFTVFIVWLAFFCFNKGIKRYSSGNLTGGRL